MLQSKKNSLRGYYYAISAISIWGVFPVYWKLLDTVNTLEIIAHRTVWCAVFTVIILSWQGKISLETLVNRPSKEWIILTFTAFMIASNWGLFIWAVANDLVIEASMGYFLSPLASIVLGRIMFREKLKPLHALAILLAVFGVVAQFISAAVLPWVGLLIALSFSGYGALRKLSTADSVTGLLIETLILTPIALLYLGMLLSSGDLAFIFDGFRISAFLLLSGIVTAIPLMLYVASARMLSLSIVSFLFYINPTLQFLLGKYLYDEPFNKGQLIGFMLIWSGLIIYIFDNFQSHTRYRKSKSI